MNLNSKYKPLFDSKSRYYIITGGRGSGKSHAISIFALLLSYEEGQNILFTRYTMTSAFTSIIPEFRDKIEELGLESDFVVNRTEIVNIRTGNTIYFRGIKTGSGNQTAALKSLSGIACWICDEAEEIPDYNIFSKINLSVRSKDAQNRIILVMNPATKEHWIYERFFLERGVAPSQNLTHGDTSYIHTTYLDIKKHLSESYVEEIERIKDINPREYEMTVLGGWRDKAEGVVFPNYKIEPFNESGDYIGVGLDFGFSNDPTAATLISIDKKRKRIYLKELIYAKGLTTHEIAEGLSKKLKDANTMIIGDSAEPRLIHELRLNHNLNVKESIKGAGSIMHGIRLMLGYQIVVDPTSTNIIRELNNYIYKEGTDKPVDNYNHSLDGIRYFVAYVLDKPNAGRYYVY